MQLIRHAAFLQCSGIKHRVDRRNGCVLRRVPEKCGRRVGRHVELRRVKRNLCIAWRIAKQKPAAPLVMILAHVNHAVAEHGKIRPRGKRVNCILRRIKRVVIAHGQRCRQMSACGKAHNAKALDPTLHAELSCQPYGPLRVRRLRRGFTRRNTVFQYKGRYADRIQPHGHVIALTRYALAVCAARAHHNGCFGAVAEIRSEIRLKRIRRAAVRHGLVP